MSISHLVFCFFLLHRNDPCNSMCFLCVKSNSKSENSLLSKWKIFFDFTTEFSPRLRCLSQTTLLPTPSPNCKREPSLSTGDEGDLPCFLTRCRQMSPRHWHYRILPSALLAPTVLHGPLTLHKHICVLGHCIIRPFMITTQLRIFPKPENRRTFYQETLWITCQFSLSSPMVTQPRGGGDGTHPTAFPPDLEPPP